jgi:uncharacterized membrane protein YbhN (UPF0104 family)
MKERLLAAAVPLLGVALFGLALAILHRELAAYHYREVLAHLGAISRGSIALAVGLTAAGYLSLTGYDALAVRWICHSLGYARIALASFIAYAFSHNVGLSFFGGSAVRYRMFSSWGVEPGELARIIAFNAITFWLGFLALGGVVSIAAPLRLPGEWHPLIHRCSSRAERSRGSRPSVCSTCRAWPRVVRHLNEAPDLGRQPAGQEQAQLIGKPHIRVLAVRLRSVVCVRSA